MPLLTRRMLANKWGRMEKGKVFGKGSKPLSDAEVKMQQAWAGEFIENVKPLLGKDELPSQYKSKASDIQICRLECAMAASAVFRIAFSA
jgi:hypothetical protein